MLQVQLGLLGSVVTLHPSLCGDGEAGCCCPPSVGGASEANFCCLSQCRWGQWFQLLLLWQGMIGGRGTAARTLGMMGVVEGQGLGPRMQGYSPGISDTHLYFPLQVGLVGLVVA